ncbi:acetyl-CoA synthetase-like protein [Colletotrichum sublineola]|nr:acetyl-CoA synthetase-like protein [Colletotrichum sublineola]
MGSGRFGEPPIQSSKLLRTVTAPSFECRARWNPGGLRFLCDAFIKATLAILEDPQQLVSDVDILGDAEHAFLRNTLSNRDTLVIPTPQLLQADFESCAQTDPSRVAIDWTGTVQVSYARLNRRANHVATMLVQRGLRPGDCVALLLEKSVEAVACILGVLKAGWIEILPVEDISLSEGEAPSVALTPKHIAYIIYTSGSTGQPKGIKVPHQAVTAAVKSMCEVEGRTKGEQRVLQLSNYVFDASIIDIFNTLSTGGTLCMAPTAELLSDMAGYIRSMDVRQAAITPTVASILQPDHVPSLETLCMVGEPLSRCVRDKWLPFCRLLNSVVVCTKEVQSSHGPAGCIGRPYPTAVAFILDPDGNSLCPYGAVGELCIGGPQLTDGYVGRDDLTSAAFAWHDDLQMRIYRTGDLARSLPGGDIECLGRKDNQVKLHGFRVELGEIEAVIRKSGLVADVVVVLATTSQKQQLVAACVFKSTAHSDDVDQVSIVRANNVEPAEKHAENLHILRQRLNSLAYYMVPKTVLPMTSLPILPSHKADRKKVKAIVESLGHIELSSYVLETMSDEDGVVPTETPLEKVLELMWEDVLGVPAIHIGREANFLSLGGDSVSAINLASVARRMGYSLAVNAILKIPKLKELATKMAAIQRRDSQRMKPVFEIPEIVKKSTSALAKVDDILRTSWLQVSETDWVGLVLRSSQLDLTLVRCQDEAEGASVIESTWNGRFAFGKPFIRYVIITYPDGTWDLVTKMDHAVYDGTLLRIFDGHFAAILRDQPIPRHTPFKDFAFHLYELDKSKDLNYWQKRLHNWRGSDLVEQPTWASVSAPLCNSVIRRPLPKADIDQIATDMGVTPAFVFQGAFQIWLSQATASRDVAFDYLLTGRNVDLPDPQTINGTTANFLPVRIDIDPEEPLTSLLQRTQDDFWVMTDHGSVGLDQIYKAAKLEREAVGNRVLFIYQPFEPAPPNDPNADARWLVLPKCKVQMPAPYAMMVEVHKAPGKTFSLKMGYDDTVLNQEEANTIADGIVKSIEKVTCKNGNVIEKRVGDL